MGDKGDREGTSALQSSSLLLAIRKRCHPKWVPQGSSSLSLLQGFSSVSSGVLKDLARLLQIFFSWGGVSDLRTIGASMYWGYQERKRVLDTQVIAYFCTWSTVWLQKPASLSIDHPVSGSSHANTNVRTSQPHRFNNFRSASFSECCPLSKAISLHTQVFQTVSVTSFDSNHTNPPLWLFLAHQIPLYMMLQLMLISVLSLQLHALIYVMVLLVSLPLLSLVFSSL